MNIHRVIGNVTLSRWHPGYQNVRLLATQPLEQETISGVASKEPDLSIVWDDLGAGIGQEIAVSDGAEASMPFRPELKAVDAYCAAILDEVYVDRKIVNQLNWSKN